MNWGMIIYGIQQLIDFIKNLLRTEIVILPH